jgi:transposase InsO family protein
VAIDYFTNWVEATVLKTLTADELVSAFFKIEISRHGCPEQLMSDSGMQMVSSALKALCRSFNFTKRESSQYHVQANGKVEKFIGFLKKSLALITPERAPCTWDEMIDHCLFVYRISINRFAILLFVCKRRNSTARSGVRDQNKQPVDARRREEPPIPDSPKIKKRICKINRKQSTRARTVYAI